MTTRTAALLTAIALSSPVMHVQAGEARAAHTFQEKKEEMRVDGRWTMHVKGGPHGDMTMTLELAQGTKKDSQKVSGTFTTPHGDLPVEGQLVDATLTIATKGGDTQVSLTAKLKDNGMLEGYISSQMGDMTWTASRATGK
jgi:hypothetical protein